MFLPTVSVISVLFLRNSFIILVNAAKILYETGLMGEMPVKLNVSQRRKFILDKRWLHIHPKLVEKSIQILSVGRNAVTE